MKMIRAAALGLSLLALCATTALAQSSPGLSNGQIPTAAQWNGYFAAKQDTVGTLSGDLSGTLPAPTVVKINGATPAAVATSGSASDLTTGTLPAGRMPALTGDVTTSAGAVATTIAGNAVTNAKAATAPANTMKGNWTGSTANQADEVMPVCLDSGSNHLNYVNGTGVICGTSAPAFSTVSGTVVAASTTNLATATNTVQSVTGNTTITSFGVGTNLYRIIEFTGTPLITYNATSLITPTGANIQAAPGDSATLISDGSGNWTVIKYTPFGTVKVSSVTGVSITSSLTQIAAITLTPGKWRITGNVSYQGSAGTATFAEGCIGTTTASRTGTVSGVSDFYFAVVVSSSLGSGSLSGFDVTVTSNTPYYLNARFSSATTDTIDGMARAERIF